MIVLMDISLYSLIICFIEALLQCVVNAYGNNILINSSLTFGTHSGEHNYIQLGAR